MKRFIKVFAILTLSLIMSGLSAQQKGFNYQAIARNADGAPLAGVTLQVQIGVVDAEAGGLLIWQEQHENVITNNNGSFNLVIGNPDAARIGGTVPLFSDINWSMGNYELNFKVNAGDGFIDLGYAPLNAVPYAKVTENITHPLPQFSIQGNGDLAPEEALFEVRNRDGRPVFAVYEDSVWVYTETSLDGKGVKGGFAVGGYRKTAKGDVVEEYMRVTPEKVRIYVDNSGAKGVKGGFAVGGYRKTAKGMPEDEYLRVTPDSVRIYIDNEGKGVKGGFAVGGYRKTAKADDPQFLTVTPDNVNTYSKSPDGGFGLYGIDRESGNEVKYMTMTTDNSFIGQGAGMANKDGKYNTFIGYNAGYRNILGSDNIFLGYQSGFENDMGSNNIFLGTGSGQKTKGSGNVFLGYNSGYGMEAGNNLLIIENSAKDSEGALVFGDFEQDILRINANLGIMRPAVKGYAISTFEPILAEIEVPSDARYKTNVETMDDAIELISNLRGVRFDWNQSAFPEKRFSDERQIGFIAQEMEVILPELVNTGSDGYKAVSYQKMTAVLVEAVKAQQQMIISRDEKIEALEKRLERIEEMMVKK